MIQPPSTTNKPKERVGWVDYSKGICIFAVVTLYSANYTRSALGDPGWMQHWADFAEPFRMPDFFLISGLFLGRVIDRSWSHYADKKVVHYGYFFVLWTLINFALLWAVGEVLSGEMSPARQLFGMLTWYPFQMLWFIQLLPAYFLFAKLTKFVPKWMMFVVACVLQTVWTLEVGPLPTSRKIIDAFWIYYIYFYVGYVFAPYLFRFAELIRNHKIAGAMGLFSWGVVNAILVQIRVEDVPMLNGLSEFTGNAVVTMADLPGVSIILGLAGAMSVITLAALIEGLSICRWVNYLGRNSIVVYLAFYWPMVFAAYVLGAWGIFAGLNGVFAFLLTAAGLVGSVGLFMGTEKVEFGRWLFHRPSWLSIYTPKQPPKQPTVISSQYNTSAPSFAGTNAPHK